MGDRVRQMASSWSWLMAREEWAPGSRTSWSGGATAGRGMDTRVDVDDYGYYPWEGHDLGFGLPGSFLSPGYPALSYVPAPPLQTPGIRPITGAGLCMSPAADISSKEGGTCPWEGAGLL